MPSLYRRGDLSIAVSTGGKSPAAARAIREDLEERYGREYAELTALLGAEQGPDDTIGPGPQAPGGSLAEYHRRGVLDILRRKGKGEAQGLHPASDRRGSRPGRKTVSFGKVYIVGSGTGRSRGCSP